MILFLAAFVLAARSIEVVFVRHGETVANATGHYNSRTIDTFSAKGEKEVADLTRQLNSMRFDAIVVSPSPRALRTIAPYLRAHPGVRAEVWPELYECCDANTKKIKGLTSSQARYGGVVKLPADIASFFTLAPSNNRFIQAPSYEDGLRQIRLAVDHLRRSFGGTGKTVLVVGHSLHGGRMIELLEGKPMVGRVRPENARIMRFREAGEVFSPVGANYLPKRTTEDTELHGAGIAGLGFSSRVVMPRFV
jgi:broad specificity phosphatase PhoE